MASSSWHGINFIIAIIALILVAIVYFVVYEHRDQFQTHGTGWNVIIHGESQAPLSSGNRSDSNVIRLPTNGHNLLVVNRSSSTTVQVEGNKNNQNGLEIGIKNNGTAPVDVVGTNTSTTGSAISVEPSNITLPPGAAITLVLVQNRFLLNSTNPSLLPLTPLESPSS